MEVEVLRPAAEFTSSTSYSSPFMTAPSSPRMFGNGSFFYSAPASPTRISSIHEYDHQHHHHHVSLANGDNVNGDCDEEFEFNFSDHQLSETSSLPADELFHGGKIKIMPLKSSYGSFDSSSVSNTEQTQDEQLQQQQRGRERGYSSCGNNRSRKLGTRSLSPLRSSDNIFNGAVQEERESNGTATSASYIANFLSAISFKKGYYNYMKWKLKNFLFRSASEGGAKDQHKLSAIVTSIYAILPKKEDSKLTGSVQSINRKGSIGGSTSSRRSLSSRGSAHEIHYTVNRTVSGEMRRRTVLPYKYGLLGCLGFTRPMQEISRGSFGSLTRGQ